MKLSEKILSLRKQSGMSQEELAEKLNVSRQAISRWEVGSAQPDAGNILQLSKLFGVTCDYLLNDDYESDRDVPQIKQTETAARKRTQAILGICLSGFGLLGNAVLYILSRFIKVMVPMRVEQQPGGSTLTSWSSEFTDYNFKYFVQEHNLEFMVAFFWLLFAAGLIILFIDKIRARFSHTKLK